MKDIEGRTIGRLLSFLNLEKKHTLGMQFQQKRGGRRERIIGAHCKITWKHLNLCQTWESKI